MNDVNISRLGDVCYLYTGEGNQSTYWWGTVCYITGLDASTSQLGQELSYTHAGRLHCSLLHVYLWASSTAAAGTSYRLTWRTVPCLWWVCATLGFRVGFRLSSSGFGFFGLKNLWHSTVICGGGPDWPPPRTTSAVQRVKFFNPKPELESTRGSIPILTYQHILSLHHTPEHTTSLSSLSPFHTLSLVP